MSKEKKLTIETLMPLVAKANEAMGGVQRGIEVSFYISKYNLGDDGDNHELAAMVSIYYNIDGETSDEDTLDNLPVYPEIKLTTVYVYWDGEIVLSKFGFISFITWIVDLGPHGEYLSVLAEALPRLYKGVASLARSLRDNGFNFDGNDCWLRQPNETSDRNTSDEEENR